MATGYNRLTNPIGIIGHRAAYMHLCEFCGVDPHNNDLFTHVDTLEDAVHQKFSRVLELDGATEHKDYHLLLSWAKNNIVNDTGARPVRDTGVEYSI